jgi:hypothetical protein
MPLGDARGDEQWKESSGRGALVAESNHSNKLFVSSKNLDRQTLGLTTRDLSSLCLALPQQSYLELSFP